MLRNAGFLALLTGSYDLAINFNSFNRDFLTIISSNSASFTWLINVLFENPEFLVIKVPLLWISTEFIKNSNLLVIREKIFKINNSDATEICTISECIYKLIERKEVLKKLKEL